MYCIRCGIELSLSNKVCPVCGTAVCHPDFPIDESLSTYPRTDFESEAVSRKGMLFVISVLALLLAVLPMTIEITATPDVRWSDYVVVGVALAYLFFIMPIWFQNPNPVVFLPIDFAAATLFSLHVCIKTGGHWFLTFALPAASVLCAIFTALVALLKYVRHGRLYMFGGSFIALCGWMLLLEFLMSCTFEAVNVLLWSLYPCITLAVIGLTLIVIAIVKPFKESLEKMFFI